MRLRLAILLRFVSSFGAEKRAARNETAVGFVVSSMNWDILLEDVGEEMVWGVVVSVDTH